MDYDVAYHLHCEITLDTGRSIILQELHQQQTYAGLIEGIPNKSLNDLLCVIEDYSDTRR